MMGRHMPDTHLSGFSTNWSVLFAAHRGTPEEQLAARRRLLAVYERAVRGYLRASVGDAEAAEELLHEFAVRLLRGDFAATAPEKGRFRSYLKTVIYHLIVDHHRSRQRWARAADLGAVPEPAAAPPEPSPDDERQFLARWRDSLIEAARAALRRQENVGGPPLAEALRLRTEHLDETDDALAA